MYFIIIFSDRIYYSGIGLSNPFTTDGSTPTRIGFRHSSFFYMSHEISRRIFRWVEKFKYSNAKPNCFFLYSKSNVILDSNRNVVLRKS